MYYVSEGWGISFKTQQESNIVGEDLEVTLGTTREDLGFNARGRWCLSIW